jgi:hypothetical protein
MMVEGMQQQGQGGPLGRGGRIASDARWLASGAAGLLAAVLALWAFRGLPGGAMSLWVSSLPLFLAGLGFGPASLMAAIAVAALALLLAGNALALGIFLAAFGAPALALVLAAGPREAPRLGLPLALFGLIPAAGILVAALLLAGEPGGLEGAMRRAAEIGLARMGLPAGDALLIEMVRVKAAAIGFWVMLALLVNAAGAGTLLVRAGICTSSPAWREARLPAWYLAFPALALVLWLAAEEGADALTLSLLLALAMPVFLHGLAAFHRASRAWRGRPMILGGAYLALLLMAVPVALAATGFGLYDILNGNRGRPSPPPQS